MITLIKNISPKSINGLNSTKKDDESPLVIRPTILGYEEDQTQSILELYYIFMSISFLLTTPCSIPQQKRMLNREMSGNRVPIWLRLFVVLVLLSFKSSYMNGELYQEIDRLKVHVDKLISAQQPKKSDFVTYCQENDIKLAPGYKFIPGVHIQTNCELGGYSIVHA